MDCVSEKFALDVQTSGSGVSGPGRRGERLELAVVVLKPNLHFLRKEASFEVTL